MRREREEAVEKIGIYIYMCNPNGIFVNICGYKNKNPNVIFVNICEAGRGGSDNIRSCPDLRVRANFLTRNHPTTSMGRVKPVWGGSGLVGAKRVKIVIPKQVGSTRAGPTYL